jgi:hypothetical protein
VSAPYKLLLDLREATYRQPISSWASKPPVVDPRAANAAAQPRLEAGAQRTLLGVGSSALILIEILCR